MTLQFKTKKNQAAVDQRAMELALFLTTNRSFVPCTLEILGKRSSPINQIEPRIKQIQSFQTISMTPEVHEYLQLMNMFYNSQNNNILGDRRGFLLEYIVGKMCFPVTMCTMIPEANAFYRGRIVSRKDIDVVFRHDEIELIECKASLKNFLDPVPLQRGPVEKLKFMEKVKLIAIGESTSCHTYLATYNMEVTLQKDILRMSGFEGFLVLSRKEILERLGA